MATFLSRLLPCLVAFVLLAPASGAQAQPTDSALSTSTITAPALEAFAKAHIAVSTLRAQVQAELAEPKAKKPAEQIAIREKLHLNTVRLLKEHGLTEAAFATLTQRVSTDNALRKDFEAALARLPGGKTP